MDQFRHCARIHESVLEKLEHKVDIRYRLLFDQLTHCLSRPQEVDRIQELSELAVGEHLPQHRVNDRRKKSADLRHNDSQLRTVHPRFDVTGIHTFRKGFRERAQHVRTSQMHQQQLCSRIEGPKLGASVVQELGAARPNVPQIARK
jgi:hypothetical protein